jgi:outer membrane protein OmpA-like peptidoglycan-associated protein/tetratricopeptide (TPR) repeat protein
MQKSCTTFIALLVFTIQLYAQYDATKMNRKAVQLYNKALGEAEHGNFPLSIQTLKGAITVEPKYAEALLSIAGMYGELKNYDSAIYYYDKAKAVDFNFYRDYELPHSINLAGKGKFEEALKMAGDFLTINNLNATSQKAGEYRRKSYDFAVEYAKTHPAADYKFSPQNMGDSINTKMLEYYPTLTIDGSEIIFTRRINNNEDFYGAHATKDKWANAKLLGGNINSNLNEGAQNISQDGQWLIFTGCNFPDGLGSCDLYISYMTADGWSLPENLGSKINTEFWESAPSLSPDKRDLYFASSRPDGFGGSDIFVSHRLPNGRWTEPENLGAEINTAGNESCPFIHADNQTLYFTSNGHPGYGDDDLFIARKGPKGKWSIPQNLGYPINTIEKEGSLVITADGKTAYYASDRSDTKGGLDLYTFELRNDVRPVKTLWIKGKVFDKKTTKGLPSAVELTDLTTKETISKIQTDETGNYLITLPIGRDYAFNVNRKGYLFFSDNFSLSKKQPDSTYHIDIALQPLEANASIVLKNIFFDTNSKELKSASQVELDKVVQLMKDNPTLTIQITGHTDNVGKAADNLKLSDNRAQSVVSYITGKGISAARLSFKGFGATQPVADNNTEDGRAKNRRTELKVVSE